LFFRRNLDVDGRISIRRNYRFLRIFARATWLLHPFRVLFSGWLGRGAMPLVLLLDPAGVRWRAI